MINIGKLIFSLTVACTLMMYGVYTVNSSIYDTRREVYANAIKVASQTATSNILDTSAINATYDGNLRDSENIPIDFNTLDLFRDTLSSMLSSNAEIGVAGVTNIEIPLVGYVGYDYIVGVTYDNTWLMPQPFTYNMEEAGAAYNGIWHFTLGDTMYIDHMDGTRRCYSLSGSSAVQGLESKSLTSILSDCGFLDRTGFTTGQEFADYVIMSNINKYLDMYSGESFSQTASNLGISLDFDLGKSKFTSDLSNYTLYSGVIDGSGMFSVIDLYRGSGDTRHVYQRIATFGGSEYVTKLGTGIR